MADGASGGSNDDCGEKSRTWPLPTDRTVPGDSASRTPTEEGSDVFGEASSRQVEPDSCKTSSATKRDESNPFSFRHFLNNRQHHGGARPKTKSTRTVHVSDTSPRCQSQRLSAAPDFASALPDFVQDHLVAEQSLQFSGNIPTRSCSLDLDNLPDFALAANGEAPYDLPAFQTGAEVGDRNDDVLQSFLPDFLSDGPMHLGEATALNQPPVSNGHENSSGSVSRSEMQQLLDENERLRRQLEETQRLLRQETRRVSRLEQELANQDTKERDEATALEAAIEKERAVDAEGTASRLKLQVKELQSQVAQLKAENRRLSSGAPSMDTSRHSTCLQAAVDIRQAATYAEHSLRQLLSGIGDLHMLACTLESAHTSNEDSG